MKIAQSIANAIWNGFIKSQARMMALTLAFLAAVWAFLQEGLESYLVELVALLPATLSQPLLPYVGFFAFVNLWFPVGEWFTMFTAYIAFVTVFIVVKFVLKLLPFIG